MFKWTVLVFSKELTSTSNWRWPSIPGLERFKGGIMHSAHWDETYKFENKRAAVIGVGSSGIQIVPELAKGSYRIR